MDKLFSWESLLTEEEGTEADERCKIKKHKVHLRFRGNSEEDLELKIHFDVLIHTMSQ